MLLAYNILKIIRNRSSTAFISFENLAKIRPIGVVSKKDIGKRSAFVNKYLWIIMPALIAPFVNTKLADNTHKTRNKKNVGNLLHTNICN